MHTSYSASQSGTVLSVDGDLTVKLEVFICSTGQYLGRQEVLRGDFETQIWYFMT